MSSTPVGKAIEGMQFAIEMINFVHFMSEEAIQTSSMALGTAIKKENLDLAEEIFNNSVFTSTMCLWNWWVVYGLRFLPNSSCWLAFWIAQDTQNDITHNKLENFRFMMNNGINPFQKGGRK